MHDEFGVGDRVEKVSGYKFPGVIVSAFDTTAGKRRYVVESLSPDTTGMLHIFSSKDLAHVQN